MKFLLTYTRKIVIFIVGISILILGIILIPLPGPGLLVCFAGLFILSMEFEWAKTHLERSKIEIRKVTAKAKARQDKIKQRTDSSATNT